MPATRWSSRSSRWPRLPRAPGLTPALGGFGALFDLAACGFKRPVLVAATDGVGTKLLACLEAGRHDTVGIDLVAMCVNDVRGAGRRAAVLPRLLRLRQARCRHWRGQVVGGIAEGCRLAGCALIGGETAEMPGMYAGGDSTSPASAVGAVERDALLPRPDGIAAGDVLLGLASSGMHSNGFSLVRSGPARAGLGLDSVCPWAPSTPLGRGAAGADAHLRRSRCSPRSPAGGVKALAHITGGGLVENLPRVLPDGQVMHLDARAGRCRRCSPGWPGPALDAIEMIRTFNSGIGMVLVVDAGQADAVRSALQAAGESVHTIGTIAAAAGRPRVEFTGLETAWPSAAPPS